jgi:hypothetical protein
MGRGFYTPAFFLLPSKLLSFRETHHRIWVSDNPIPIGSSVNRGNPLSSNTV